MRPARGRSAAATKPKTCFVRLEKCSPREDKSDDEDRKKLQGPIKKRPVVVKKSPGRPQKKSEINEDLSKYMLATARSRRTPKPNPKYSNDDIVTPKLRALMAGRSDSNNGSDYEFEDDEEIHESTEPEVELSSDSGESSDEMFAENRSKSILKSSVSPQLSMKRGPGRPPKSKIITQFDYDAKVEKPRLSLMESDLGKRKLDYDSDKGTAEQSDLIARNKRLNIQLYDGSDSDASTISPSEKIRVNKVSSPKPPLRTFSKFNEASRLRKAKMVMSEDEEMDDAGGASTIDDFETMPTFTIVNINDIINKKGDVLIQKTSSQRPSTTDMQHNTSSPQDDEGTSPSSQVSRNRRKTMHTTILSDKIDHSKLNAPPPRSPFPPRKPAHLNNNSNNNMTKSTTLNYINANNSGDNFKSAPRILNSVLAKKTKPITSIVTKSATKELKSEGDNNYETLTHKQAKENVQSNLYGSGTVGSSTVNNSRKLPTEKILVQRQGNKLIKKITCFETWYVINIPPSEPIVHKSTLDISLTKLGNDVKEISLPSSEWTYKITLQKLSPAQIINNTEVFTGEVQDPKINESDKHNYQPINVMFRRTSKTQKMRMPYDRAVIFRNKTFFTNIDGKNVRLLGAPQYIKNYSEIEILLQIVDEMTLYNPFVEQSTFVM